MSFYINFKNITMMIFQMMLYTPGFYNRLSKFLCTKLGVNQEHTFTRLMTDCEKIKI